MQKASQHSHLPSQQNWSTYCSLRYTLFFWFNYFLLEVSFLLSFKTSKIRLNIPHSFQDPLVHTDTLLAISFIIRVCANLLTGPFLSYCSIYTFTYHQGAWPGQYPSHLLTCEDYLPTNISHVRIFIHLYLLIYFLGQDCHLKLLSAAMCSKFF